MENIPGPQRLMTARDRISTSWIPLQQVFNCGALPLVRQLWQFGSRHLPIPAGAE